MTLILEIPPSPTASWSEVCAVAEATGHQLDVLPPAQRMVAFYLRQGLSNREMATILGKSEATVKNQVSACLRRFNVPTRARLIALLR